MPEPDSRALSRQAVVAASSRPPVFLSEGKAFSWEKLLFWERMDGLWLLQCVVRVRQPRQPSP